MKTVRRRYNEYRDSQLNDLEVLKPKAMMDADQRLLMDEAYYEVHGKEPTGTYTRGFWRADRQEPKDLKDAKRKSRPFDDSSAHELERLKTTYSKTKKKLKELSQVVSSLRHQVDPPSSTESDSD